MSQAETVAAELPVVPAFVSKSGRSRAWSERAAEVALLTATLLSALVVLVVVVFVVRGALPVIARNGIGLVATDGWDQQLPLAFHSGSWTFGLRELIIGTVVTTGGALILTFILGMATAVALAEFAPARVARPIESVMRLLAGFPSVVFGLIGIAVVAPMIQATWITNNLEGATPFVSTGECLLAAILVLTFMIMPFFVSVAVDSMRAVPDSYRLGGQALGMTKWRVTTRLVVPSASAGILAGLVLAAARGVGEAIAMMMVGGAVAHIPNPSSGLLVLLEPIRTLAGGIVENGEGTSNDAILSALYVAATLILFASVFLSVLARLVTAGFQSRMRLVSDRSA